MNPVTVQDFQVRVDRLFQHRGMMPGRRDKVIVKSFYEHFRAQAWYHHCIHGDGMAMLTVLDDDAQLVGAGMFQGNYYGPLPEQVALKTNRTWQALRPSIIRFKGERIGAGEFYFPLTVQGWRFEKTGGRNDGAVAGGTREIKFGGGSLKPTASASHRIIDHLNATVFQGNRPGPENQTKKSRGQSWSRWYQWFSAQPNRAELLQEYFGRLYPDNDVGDLVRDLLKISDCKDFYHRVGQEVMRWYRDIDGWDSLIIIDAMRDRMANIADIDDLAAFPTLKLSWVTAREKDVRQHADGYVNIKI